MAISVEQQAALEAPVVRVLYFVFFDFISAQARFTNSNVNITWGGYDWIGLGEFGSISEVEEEDNIDAKALTFTLNAGIPANIALAAGDVRDYRGRDAKMYMCPLDEQFRLIGTPELCWKGYMDIMSIGIEGVDASIALKCETAAYGFKRLPALRMNAPQQKKKYPTDTGFDYLNDLIANPQTWLSKNFQRI